MADTIWTYNGRIPTLGGGNRIPYFTPTDSDAQAFLDATGITDDTIKEAIDTFVIDMKSNSLWSKMTAIYPMVGGTADTHKYNLKDPRDLDAAYRITWSGGITHSSTGVQGNGTTGYGNTHINDESNLTRNNKHLSVYSRTNADGIYVSAGVYRNTSTSFHSIYLKSSNEIYYRCNDTSGAIAVPSSTGFFVGSRIVSTEQVTYRNGSSLGTKVTSTLASTLSYNHYVLALNHGNNSNTPIQFSPREYCYFSFGEGFTPAQVSTYNTLVQAFQTALGRNV